MSVTCYGEGICLALSFLQATQQPKQLAKEISRLPRCPGAPRCPEGLIP